MSYRSGYIPHDWKMRCDRCGAYYRRSEMREEWTGLWVCTRGCWESRHPQDFVKVKPEDTTVWPQRPDVVSTMGETTLNGALTKDATAVTLTSASGLSEKDPIGITLDNSVVHWTFITADPVASAVVLHQGIPCAAASGNTVLLPSLNNEEWQ